jgi:hypothetical protein
MKVALKLLLSYLVASFLMTAVSIAVHPTHAHVPTGVVLLFFPLMPLLVLKDLFTRGIGLQQALSMGVFALVFGCMAWGAFRVQASEAARADRT